MKRFLLLAALVCAACSRVSEQAAAPLAASNPWTIHGVLRIAGRQEPDTLMPIIGTQVVDTDLDMFWSGHLLNWSDDNQFVPELATEAPTPANGGIAKDGLTITYHLRRGVTWQDGAPFDARDVRFTWRAIMNPDNNVASRTGYDRVRDVQIVDDHTVRFLLKERYAPAVDTFFAPSAGPIALLPSHLLAKYANLNHAPYDVKPVGTGPFIVDSWEQGVGVSMHANPHYWRGRPKLDGVRFLTVHDNNTMLVMMRTGEADLYYRIRDGQIPQLGAIDGTHKLVTPFVGYEMLIYNTARPPLDDIAVREAISYAVDKRRVVVEVTHGSGTVTASDQPPWLWAYDAAVPQYDANPAKARSLLAADGWAPGADGIRLKSGRRLAISISTPAGFRDGLQFEGLFQQWMRDVGVDVEIKNYPSNLLYATFGGGGILAVGKYDTAFVDWYNGIDPDDSIQWECAYVPPAGQNFARWCDPQYDAAETVALTTYGRAQRKRAYANAQLRLAKGLPADFLYFIGRTDLASNRLTGYRPAP